MIEGVLGERLANYGMAGLFIAYLIFDRQVLMKGLKESIIKNTEVLNELCSRIKK